MTHVDMLKALAILLVVMGHVFYFSTYNETAFDDELIFNVICTFHVPLFWFLSGFVVYEAPTMRKSLRKSWSFLRPMLVVGFVNALLIGKVSDFFLDGGHNGYWYLVALAVFYLVMPVFRMTSPYSAAAPDPSSAQESDLTPLLGKEGPGVVDSCAFISQMSIPPQGVNHPQPLLSKEGSKDRPACQEGAGERLAIKKLLLNKKEYRFFSDVLLAMAVWMVFKVLLHLPDPIESMFNIYSCFTFWPFFIIGFIVRKYELQRLLTDRYSLVKGLLLAAAYVLTLAACYDRLHTMEGLTSIVVEGLIALLAIAALFALFYHFRESQTAVRRQMVFVGRHTLHIYIFHYFFIRFISTPFLQAPQMNVLLKLLIVTAIAVAVVYASILLGWLYDGAKQRLTRILCGSSAA